MQPKSKPTGNCVWCTVGTSSWPAVLPMSSLVKPQQAPSPNIPLLDLFFLQKYDPRTKIPINKADQFPN